MRKSVLATGVSLTLVCLANLCLWFATDNAYCRALEPRETQLVFGDNAGKCVFKTTCGFALQVGGTECCFCGTNGIPSADEKKVCCDSDDGGSCAYVGQHVCDGVRLYCLRMIGQAGTCGSCTGIGQTPESTGICTVANAEGTSNCK